MTTKNIKTIDDLCTRYTTKKILQKYVDKFGQPFIDWLDALDTPEEFEYCEVKAHLTIIHNKGWIDTVETLVELKYLVASEDSFTYYENIDETVIDLIDYLYEYPEERPPGDEITDEDRERAIDHVNNGYIVTIDGDTQHPGLKVCRKASRTYQSGFPSFYCKPY
jgi:hypothetical protein